MEKYRSIGKSPVVAAARIHKNRKPSYTQVEVLTEFLEAHPQLATFSRLTEDRYKANQLWTKLAVRLNAINGSRRNASGWKRYWKDKKTYIRRIVGTGKLSTISRTDERLMRLLRLSSGPDDSTEKNPPSVGSNTSSENLDTSQIQTELWSAAQTPDPPDEDGARELEDHRPTSSASVRREQESVEWMREVEQQRLTLEQERVTLMRERNQQKARFQEQELERKRKRNQEEACFQDKVLERMGDVFSRVANALMQIATNRYD